MSLSIETIVLDLTPRLFDLRFDKSMKNIPGLRRKERRPPRRIGASRDPAGSASRIEFRPDAPPGPPGGRGACAGCYAGRLQAKTIVLLGTVVVSSAFGNLALGYGMRAVGDISSLPPLDLIAAGIGSLASPWVLCGLALLCVFFAAHTLLLSWADLSFVVLVTAIGYVLVVVLSALLLGETVTLARWCGTVLIACGVGIAGSTPESTVESAS